MKKVKGLIQLKKQSNGTWKLQIFDTIRIISQCLEQWHKSENAISIDLEMEVKSVFQFKTNSQLGYLHAAIKPVLIKAYQDFGDKTSSQKEIWDKIKAHVGFIEEKFSPVDGASYWDVISCRDASKEQVTEFIDNLIQFAGEFEIRIETPEEYKSKMGIKELK